MSIEVAVTADEVRIEAGGWDAVWALSRGVTLPRSEVTKARVADRRELAGELGWRVGGGHFPGRMITGHWTWKRRKGLRQLWFAYTDSELLVIDTTRSNPARIVVQHPDRERIAELINAE